MFKRIFRSQGEVSRPRHGVSKSRPPHGGGQIRRQFMQQINGNEFDMILLPQRPLQAESVQAPQQELGFVFQPMATSTPRRKAKTSDPSIGSTMPELIDEPENHRPGARLTMSQFIGTPPSKRPKAHDHTISQPTSPDVDEVAVKLPKFLADDSNGFETIVVEDFTDGDSHASGIDLNKTEDILKLIHGGDYMERSFEFLNDEPELVPDSPYAINDSTRCIFKDMLRNTNAREEKRLFRKPNLLPHRKFHKTERHVTKPRAKISNFLLEELASPEKRRRVLDGLQLRTELRNLYEFLKLLFAGCEDNDGDD